MSLQKKRIYATVLLALALIEEEERRGKRKIWAREWLRRRNKLGCYENLMRELALEDKEGYRRLLRMNTGDFEFLLEKISPLIEKQNTVMRYAIPTAERLALTLRYLATGETQSLLSFQF